MCIAILNQKRQLSRIELENAARRNPDGFGLAWTEKLSDGSMILQTFHSMSGAKWIAEYEKLRRKVKGAMLLHARIKTSGKLDIPNCHPFTIGDGDTAFIHNGMLPIGGDRECSDTNLFAQLVMSSIVQLPNWWDDFGVWHLIDEYCGAHNKLVFLRSYGDFKIVNERAGIWDADKDTWFSNSSCSAPWGGVSTGRVVYSAVPQARAGDFIWNDRDEPEDATIDPEYRNLTPSGKRKPVKAKAVKTPQRLLNAGIALDLGDDESDVVEAKRWITKNL